MRIRNLAGTLAMSGLVALSVPAEAEAAHRHSRSCGHDRGYSSRSYRAPRYSSGYRGRGYSSHRSYRSYDRYRSYSYRPYRSYSHRPYSYGYGYGGRYSPRYGRAHYHGRSFCLRPHVSIRIGF